VAASPRPRPRDNADGPAERRRGPWFGSAGCTPNAPSPRTRDNLSHAASEGWGRGSDLAVTAGELNAGAGMVGALPMK